MTRPAPDSDVYNAPLSAVDYLSLLAEHYRRVLAHLTLGDSSWTTQDMVDMATEALDDAGWLPRGIVGPRNPQ